MSEEAVLGAERVQREVEILKNKHARQLGIHNEESKVEEVGQIDEERVRKEAKEFVRNVKQVYVTFKSMQAKNLAEKLFYKRSWTKLFRITEHFNSKNKQLTLVEENKQADDKHGSEKPYGPIFIIENPRPEGIYFEEEFCAKKDAEFRCRKVSCEPDIINWSNFDSSWCDNFFYKALSLLAVACVIGLTLLLLFLFKNHQMQSGVRESPFMRDEFSCEAYPNVTLHDAWVDWEKP